MAFNKRIVIVFFVTLVFSFCESSDTQNVGELFSKSIKFSQTIGCGYPPTFMLLGNEPPLTPCMSDFNGSGKPFVDGLCRSIAFLTQTLCQEKYISFTKKYLNQTTFLALVEKKMDVCEIFESQKKKFNRTKSSLFEFVKFVRANECTELRTKNKDLAIVSALLVGTTEILFSHSDKNTLEGNNKAVPTTSDISDKNNNNHQHGSVDEKRNNTEQSMGNKTNNSTSVNVNKTRTTTKDSSPELTGHRQVHINITTYTIAGATGETLNGSQSIDGSGTGRLPADTGGFPTHTGMGGSPTDKGTGGSPTDKDTGGFPTHTGMGGSPTDKGTGGSPTDKDTGGFPTHTGMGVSPTDKDTGGSPTDKDTGGFPTHTGMGGSPTDKGTGGSPTDKGTGGFPTHTGMGGSPTDKGTGGSPTDKDTGGFPRHTGMGVSPTDKGTGGSPTDKGTGGSPTDKGTGGFPTVEGTGGSPTDKGTNGYPADKSTSGLKTLTGPKNADYGNRETNIRRYFTGRPIDGGMNKTLDSASNTLGSVVSSNKSGQAVNKDQLITKEDPYVNSTTNALVNKTQASAPENKTQASAPENKTEVLATKPSASTDKIEKTKSSWLSSFHTTTDTNPNRPPHVNKGQKDFNFGKNDDKSVHLSNSDLNKVSGYNYEDDSPGSGHFMAYFLTAVVFCIAGYVVFHNKQKIVAFIVEGRSSRQRRRTSRGGEYKKLQSDIEEVVPSLDKTTSSKNFIY